jgi:putative effector of murein hydrolase/putative effector of murein hydrolase LrgA (UPF0299 family)
VDNSLTAGNLAMTGAGPRTRKAVAAAAVLVLLARRKDVRHLPRIVLKEGSPAESFRACVAVCTLFAYERMTAALLRRLGLTKVPSTIAAMMTLFAGLRIARAAAGESLADKCVQFLSPGAAFLGKWFAVFLVPAIVNIDKSVQALPPYGPSVYARSLSFLMVGWVSTHVSTAAMATLLAPRRTSSKTTSKGGTVAVAQAAASPIMSQEETTRRAWILATAIGFLGASPVAQHPGGHYRAFAVLAELGATISSFELAKTIPVSIQRFAHPLLVSGVAANLTQRFIGPAAPYMHDGVGVGDRLLMLLPAAVSALGLRMYTSAHLWYDNPRDFQCVLVSCGASAFITLSTTAFLAVSQSSPISVPAPLALPMLHRSVMAALGIDGSQTIGPECDPKLAVLAEFVHGALGASFGKVLLESCHAVVNCSSPLVRGVAMGCSAHSVGTAGLLGQGDGEAAAIAGASMCLAGAAHTFALRLPGVVDAMRSMAALALQS